MQAWYPECSYCLEDACFCTPVCEAPKQRALSCKARDAASLPYLRGTRTLQPDIVIYSTGTLTTIPCHKISYLSMMWVTLPAAGLDVLVRHLPVRGRK